MNYKLAKKLKDAGFYQGIGDGEYLKEHSFNTVFENFIHQDEHPCLCYVPTLSELVKACKECVFFDLIKGKDNWICTDHYIKVDGPTPEEAVATLWLKLNEKK